MNEEELLNLRNMGRGAAMEIFDRAFEKLIRNSLDPNTPATAKRRIIMTFTFKPNEDRSFSPIQVDTEIKLAQDKPFITQIFFGMDANGIKASEYNPKQLGLGFNPGPRVEKEP